MSEINSEMHRLFRREESIRDTPLGQEYMVAYSDACKPEAVAARGSKMVEIRRGGTAMTEPADIAEVMHAWLNERSVPFFTE